MQTAQYLYDDERGTRIISPTPAQCNAMQYNSFVINATFAKLIIFTFSLNCIREVLSQLCDSVRFCSGVVNVSYIINQQPTFLDLTSVLRVSMLKI